MYKQHIFQSDRELPDYLKWQILSFLRFNSPEGFQGQNENRNWINNPKDTPIHVAITTDSNNLISYCSVVRKKLEHAGFTYNCWGLTGIMTYPPFRNRGFGKQVVDLGTKLIREGGADIGMFHCSHKLKNFYIKSGWEPMEKTVVYVGDQAKPRKSTELTLMIFVSERAKSNKIDFESKPVYFGEDTW